MEITLVKHGTAAWKGIASMFSASLRLCVSAVESVKSIYGKEINTRR